MAEHRVIPESRLRGELKDAQIGTRYPKAVIEELNRRRAETDVPVAAQIRQAVIASLKGSLSPEDSDTEPVPLVGAIHAGDASGQQQLDEVQQIVCNVLPTGKQYLYLEIEGDSMNCQVPPGAIALVEGGKLPRDGQTVAVKLEYPDHTEFTLKRFHPGADATYLEPDSTNPEHKTLVQSDTRPSDMGPGCVWLDPATVNVAFAGVFTGAYIAKPGTGAPVTAPKPKKKKQAAAKLPGVV